MKLIRDDITLHEYTRRNCYGYLVNGHIVSDPPEYPFLAEICVDEDRMPYAVCFTIENAKALLDVHKESL